jgi:hypothetical protein
MKGSWIPGADADRALTAAVNERRGIVFAIIDPAMIGNLFDETWSYHA